PLPIEREPSAETRVERRGCDHFRVYRSSGNLGSTAARGDAGIAGAANSRSSAPPPNLAKPYWELGAQTPLRRLPGGAFSTWWRGSRWPGSNRRPAVSELGAPPPAASRALPPSLVACRPFPADSHVPAPSPAGVPPPVPPPLLLAFPAAYLHWTRACTP